MTCPGCGSTVQADFAFCPRCGGKLSAARPSSSGTAPAPPAPGDRALADASTARDRRAEGDRRLVTVLFADLAGFTALAESLDPEEVRALQTDLFQELSGAIERYDGFVEKFVGDAVMAVFGAPRAHEDDPERALHAALLMHERVAALSERWEPRVGRPLALHVGVNTGPVVAGTIGSASGGAYAVTGDTVNTASRLQSRRVGRRDLRQPVHPPADRARLPPGPGGRDRDEGEEPAACRLPARGGARDPALRARPAGAGTQRSHGGPDGRARPDGRRLRRDAPRPRASGEPDRRGRRGQVPPAPGVARDAGGRPAARVREPCVTPSAPPSASSRTRSLPPSSGRRTAWLPAIRSRSRGRSSPRAWRRWAARRRRRPRSRRSSDTSWGWRPPTASAMSSPSSSSARSSSRCVA